MGARLRPGLVISYLSQLLIIVRRLEIKGAMAAPGSLRQDSGLPADRSAIAESEGRSLGEGWSGREDLNLRPYGPEPNFNIDPLCLSMIYGHIGIRFCI